jgi:hypothetical protein
LAGSYVGFCTQLSLSTLAPKFTPSFRFVTDRGSEAYDFEKAREVTRQVFSRRGKPWSSIEEALFEYVRDIAPEVEK